jgi:LysM repeat protein
VEPGQSLWEIAKRFHTRGADILEANGLDGEPLEEGSFLLIPKTR